jgi:Ser/Thr protein kinase RdoA (MazF antagonist)
LCAAILPGGRCPVLEEVLTPDLYESWGQTLAKLHNASEGCRDPRRPSWRDRLDQAGRELSSDNRAAHAALRKLRAALEAHCQTPSERRLSWPESIV